MARGLLFARAALIKYVMESIQCDFRGNGVCCTRAVLMYRLVSCHGKGVKGAEEGLSYLTL